MSAAPDSTDAAAPRPPRPDRAAWLWFAAVAVVFSPALGGEFLNWDDQEWITANPLVVSPDRRAWLDIWTTARLGSYYPVYYSVLRILWSLAGAVPGWIEGQAALERAWTWGGGAALPFHATGVLVFAGAAALWHEVLRRLGIGPAGRALGVAFFALHPLRVESVAWASALRDVLSLQLLVTALWLHLSEQRAHRRIFGPLAFGAALLAKSMVFALAPAPLLIDLLWRRKSWSESWPRGLAYLGLGAAGAAVSFLSFRPIASENLYPQGDLWHSLPVIGMTQLRYLQVQVWPTGLAALPTTPEPSVVGWIALAAGVAAVAVCAALLARRWRLPLLLVALYLLPMGPVSGVLPLAWPVADRYTLLPALAVSLGLAWIADRGWEPVRGPLRAWCGAAVTPLTGVVAAALALSTLQTLPHWKDSEALWLRSLEEYPREWAAHLNYAGVVGGRLEMDDAVFHLQVARGLSPRREIDRAQITGLLLFAELLRAGMPEQVIAGYGNRYSDGVDDGRQLAALSLDMAAAGLVGPCALVLRRAEELGAPPAAPAVVRGTLAGRQGRWARALLHARSGLDELPGDPNLLTLSCMALLSMGRSDLALEVAGQLAVQIPGSDPVEILREIAGISARQPTTRR